MATNRSVPENRIVRLDLYKSLSSNSTNETMIREIGMEIAKKLFEFDKILIREVDDINQLWGCIEIIVPETPKRV